MPSQAMLIAPPEWRRRPNHVTDESIFSSADLLGVQRRGLAPDAAGRTPIDAGLVQALKSAADVIGEVAAEAKASGTPVTWQDEQGALTELLTRGDCAGALTATYGRLGEIEAAGRGPRAIGLRWAGNDRPDSSVRAIGTLAVGAGTLAVAVTLHRLSAPALVRLRGALSRIIPLLADQLDHWVSLAKSARRAEALAAAIDTIDLGVALLDADGRATFINTALDRSLAARDGLVLNGAMLAAVRQSDTVRLQSAIAQVLNAAPSDSPVVAITRAKGSRPLLVAISQAVPRSRDHAATVRVFDPSLDLRPFLEPVCRLYGLSPVETRLTCLLADGATLTEAADGIHVREQTARSYLKQIFLKTDTNRQAELVWLMLKSCVRTAQTCPVTYY